MNEITLQLSDDILARLQTEADRLNKPINDVIHRAIASFLEDAYSTDTDILTGLRLGMQQALAGDYRPAHDVLDEMDQTVDSHDDDR
jgi:predicted transcriptional regulator